MLLPMLKAVSSMLENKTSPDTIGCAKKVIDELIVFYEVDANPKPVFKEKNTQGESPKLEPPKKEAGDQPTVVTNGEEWMITVDENKFLVIKDFPLDGMVELDGKKMKYSETRGLLFKNARIL